MSMVLLLCLYCEGMFRFRFGGGRYMDLGLVLIKFRKCNGKINKNIFVFGINKLFRDVTTND